MTLTRLLGIDLSLVGDFEFASLGLADRIWTEHGHPVEPRALADVLELVLQRCKAEGIQYAPVLLQRKKALQRGTFVPMSHHVTTSVAGRAKPRNGECAQCAGRGFIVNPGGMSATLCTCWIKKERRERLH